jgi:hypothetical protein
MIKLTWPRVAAWRIRRHHLDRPAPATSMLAVASRLCGLHAQVMSSAELTLWARVQDLNRGAVHRALWEDHALIKTWAARGTLHLLPAADLPMWHAALRTSRRYRRPAFWKRCYGITLDELDRLTEAIGVALDGRVMTREELASEVGRITGSAAFRTGLAQGGWGTILKPAAFSGHLCFAPSVGQRVRFTRPDKWVTSQSRPVDPKSATADLTRRFLAAYGPATYTDLGRWWGGGGITTAKQWIASLGEEVTQVDLAGDQAWVLTTDARELREAKPEKSVSLLPAFDQYVIGASRHAENLLPGVPRRCVYRPQGWVSAVLLVNGLMQGTWRHEIKGSRVEVVIEPFIKLPVWVRRRAADEAERLAAFLNCSLDLAWES